MKTSSCISAHKIFSIALLPVLVGVAVVDRSLAQSQSDATEVGRNIGVYTEAPVDMTVKVIGGDFTVTRSWDGGKKRWLINPQHEPLILSTEKQGEAFGYQLAKEISRGPRKSTQVAPGVWKRKSTEKSSIKNIPASVAQIASTNNFEYCKNKGEENFEVIYAAKDGYKWVSGPERSWAQYDSNGILRSWGKGNFLVAKLLYDNQGKLRGYADILDHEVITFERDSAGRIKQVKDYEGREVNYTYNAAGLIETVTDMDGVKTRYDYDNGNIVLKTIGDDSNSVPGEEVNDKTTITYSYFSSKGELRSIETPESKINYQYEYDKDNKLYTTIKTIGDRITRITKTVDDVTASIEINGQYVSRMIQLCEDTATINENNGVTYTDRDSLGMMAAIVRPDGKKSTFQYIAANWPEVLSSWDTSTKPWGVVSSSNPDGPLITYDRDKNGKVKTAVIQASSGEKRYWTFKYDNFGSKTEERLQAGEVLDDSLDYIQRWSYTDFGAPKSYKVGINGPIWQYQYNSRANVTSIIAPDGGEVKYLYTQSGKLKNITNQIGHTVDYKYTKRGLLSSLVERYEVGKESTTKYLYNHRGFIRKILDPFGEAWSYEYDEADELSTLIDPLGKKVTYQYDAKGRETLLIDGNGATVAHEYFDTAPPGAAPQTEIAFPLQVLVKYPTYVEQQQFDIMGRLIKKTLVSNDKSVTEDINYEYDALGNLVVVIRPDGERVEYTWDFLNRIKSIKAPNEGVTSIAYSQGDRKVIYTDSQGGKITYEFDEAQRLIKKIGADGIITSYTYNINGNKETVTRGNGQIFKFAYDEAQRLKSTEIFSSIGAPTPLRSINYSRNLRGDITAVIDGSLLQHYILDPIGRVLTSATTYDTGFTKTNSYTYTASGLLKSETTVDGTVLSYLWDSANQFQGINIPSKGSIIVGYTLQNFDQPSSITFPGGSKKIFEYDSLRRLKKISSVDQVGNVLLDYGYTLQAGPLTGAVIKNLSTEHGAYIYSYDKAFRLTGVQYPNATEENFTYDELGRRQPVTGGPWSYTATGAVTDTGSVQYTYDGNGNRKTKTEAGITTHYFYDENDNLARIETPLGTVIAKYTYDNLSRRMSKQIGGTKTYFYYNETGLAAELDSNGTVTRQYLFAPDGEWTSSLLAIEENDLYYFSHNDHLGTPQKLVTSDGNISWSARYKAFGETDVLTSAIQNYLRFPGQYADLETGLYSNFHRHYDPVLGTYIEQDSYGPLDNFTTLVKSVFQLSRIKGRPTFDRWKGISEGTSKVDQDPNLYTYTSGNPVNFYDPFGLYGTNSCEYYVQRCLESGGKYYCKTVKYACNTFPKYPDPNPDEDNDFEGWPRCTRQCLQDCDREQNATQNFCPPEPDPNTDSFFDLGATGCHFKCYIECGTEWFSNAIVPEAY